MILKPEHRELIPDFYLILFSVSDVIDMIILTCKTIKFPFNTFSEDKMKNEIPGKFVTTITSRPHSVVQK